MYDGGCLCAEGFHGRLCQKKCSCPEHSECNSKTGECICQNDFYGNQCLPCNCSNTEQCDPFSGTCSCRPGYYGKHCDKNCSCFNGAYCGNNQLDNCICSSGWAGSECSDCDTGIVKATGSLFCEDKCLHCYNGHWCSVENGDCECSPGWQGNRCDQICDEGYYGNNCSEVCRCKGNKCNHITGICQCESEEPGEQCEDPCPDNCLACEDNVCISCKSGWTGEHCSNRCKPGLHGDSCKETCTECNCSASCHHISGSCQEIVRCEEHRCKYRNARICIENPFKLECQNGWTGHFCNITTSLTTTKDISHTVRRGTTVSPMGDEFTGHMSNLYTVIGIPVMVIITVFVAVPILIVFRRRKLQQNINGKNRCSGNQKKLPTADFDDATSKPRLSTLSLPVTGNSSEFDSFIVNDVTQTQSKSKPIYASVNKHKKGAQQSNAIKEKNEDTEPVKHDALINSREPISTSEDYAIKASSFKGPYETISLDKLSSNIILNGNDTKCDNMLDGICTKQHNINTDDGAYELLSHPRQNTMVVHMNF
ncbi:multiple epidermal growth factor-like domains protein 10 [Ptychodera flava]|uniref:multiple epidermal growth factor-like domains protein 10 n=1 Tax=Ptychodera flava TaxID=63121 RepID=UPI00396A002C